MTEAEDEGKKFKRISLHKARMKNLLTVEILSVIELYDFDSCWMRMENRGGEQAYSAKAFIFLHTSTNNNKSTDKALFMRRAGKEKEEKLFFWARDFSYFLQEKTFPRLSDTKKCEKSLICYEKKEPLREHEIRCEMFVERNPRQARPHKRAFEFRQQFFHFSFPPSSLDTWFISNAKDADDRQRWLEPTK